MASEKRTGKPVSGEALHMTDPNDLGTISVNGTVYKIEDWGYVCGDEFAILLLSGSSAVIHPSPYCGICEQCWHPSGDSIKPDWTECGTPVGDYGIFVRFLPAYQQHCLGILGYRSVATDL